MGRHTTPGAPAPHGQRDDVIGWGAFATVLAAVLVGLTAGWVHAVTVALLGGLSTAALWFVRTHPDSGVGRGRHASDTPWSASDLLDLKDDVDDRAGAAGAAPTASAPPARRSGRRRAEPAPAGGGDPLEWVPGVRISPEADVSGPPAPGAGPEDAPDAGASDDGPLPARRRSGRRAARTPDGVAAAAAEAAPRGAVTIAAPPVAAVPMSRRSRRAAEEAGGPTRPVLPVAPFEPAAAPTGPTAPAGPDDVAAGEVAASVPVEPAAHGVPAAGPLADPLADPLAGPVDPGSLAAEPAVLDPALDGLWPAPVLELTVEQPLPPGLAAAPPAPAAVTAPVPVPVPSPDPAPEPGDVAGPHDRERAAAELDPLWARRARRPQGPRRAHERPGAQRREPQPVVLHPMPGYAEGGTANGTTAGTTDGTADLTDDSTANSSADGAGDAAAVDGGGPLVVVLPEPDVPDVLMLPESDVVQDGTEDTAPADPDDPAWTGAPGRPAGRPAPGTLSLDELLVLHTRRPGGRRAGSADRPGDEAGRRLE